MKVGDRVRTHSTADGFDGLEGVIRDIFHDYLPLPIGVYIPERDNYYEFDENELEVIDE